MEFIYVFFLAKPIRKEKNRRNLINNYILHYRSGFICQYKKSILKIKFQRLIGRARVTQAENVHILEKVLYVNSHMYKKMGKFV